MTQSRFTSSRPAAFILLQALVASASLNATALAQASSPCLRLFEATRVAPPSPEFRNDWTPRGLDELVAAYESRVAASGSLPQSERIQVTGIEQARGIDQLLKLEGDTVTFYNPSTLFNDGTGRVVRAVRAEPSRSEFSAVVITQSDAQDPSVYRVLSDAPAFPLQDPFVSRVHGQLVFGGVRVYPRVADGKPVIENGHPVLDYDTAFYFGKTIHEMDPFKPSAVGPYKMKDIRVVEIADGPLKGKLCIFTRPQGGDRFGPGKVGFYIADSLAELNPARIEQATILEGLFLKEEWGGVNSAYALEGGLISVTGHMAKWKIMPDGSKERLYAAIEFLFDPQTGTWTQPQVTHTRTYGVDGLNGPAKRPDLKDVVFPSGLEEIRNTPNGAEAMQPMGMGDSEIQRVRRRNIFNGHRFVGELP